MEIKNRYTGEVIFSDNSDNIKDTLLNAIKSRADLRGCDLRECDLRECYFYESDLRGSSLNGSSLNGSSLNGSSLRECDLRECDLRGCDLRGCNLYGIDLTGCKLYGAVIHEAYLQMYCKWYVSIKDNTIQIGCKNKTIDEWDNWFSNSNEEFFTSRDTEDFKRIKAMFYAYKTYYEIVNN